MDRSNLCHRRTGEGLAGIRDKLRGMPGNGIMIIEIGGHRHSS